VINIPKKIKQETTIAFVIALKIKISYSFGFSVTPRLLVLVIRLPNRGQVKQLNLTLY